MSDKTLMLKVMEADPNLVGKKLVAIDIDAKNILGLSNDDFVLIKGKKETLAKIWPMRPSEEGQGIIRMDSFTRKNAGVSLGDAVVVKKAKADPAKKVTFAPMQEVHFPPGSYARLVKKLFLYKPVTVGEEVMFSIFGSPVLLTIQKTLPKGHLYIDDDTEVELLETPTSTDDLVVPKVSYEDLGGMKKAIAKVREMIELPIRHPELFGRLGVEPPKGVLLYGPPGTGKTLLAKAVANESNANFIVINGPSVMSRFVGGAEEKLRAIFKDAQDNAPSIIFIDEIDALAPIREEVAGDVEKRVVGQLLGLMDGLEARGQIIVIAATNRPNAIDIALRRPGRFDREIEISAPDREGRKEILEIITRDVPLDKDVDLEKIVVATHGFVGADLSAVVKEAAMQSLRRLVPDLDLTVECLEPEELEKISITMQDFKNALKEVNPSALREVFVEVPNVRWEDVGALDNVKNELKKMVEWPLKYSNSFEEMGISPIKGILLYGPPGTGKTMLAKAIANECEANFISVKGPEIFSKWLGDSERAIRNIFQKARQTAPCIVFFDELDAIAPKRGIDTNITTSRVVNQLLSELDGIGPNKSIVFLAATNRIQHIDNALLRPGRIDQVLYVGLPDEKGRLDILTKLSRGMKIVDGGTLNSIAKETDNLSGAELNSLLRESALAALEAAGMKTTEITLEDLRKAIKKIWDTKDQSGTGKEKEEDKDENEEDRNKKDKHSSSIR